MGSGASATLPPDAAGQLEKASVADLQAALGGWSAESRERILASLKGVHEAGPPAVAEASASAAAASGAEGAAAAAGAADIPAEWGWPKEPYEPEDLKEYVYVTTQLTADEKWEEALEARAIDSKKEDHLAEKAFANTLLDKEGMADHDDKHHKGIDPNAYKKGRWYRFLNHKGDCYVYVHNYTRDITATRPANFTDLTDEEKKRLKKLGVYIKEVPREIERIYDNQKAIPILYGSADTCEALKTYFVYDKAGELLDVTKLKRVNSRALEESRAAIVNALKLGKTLCIYLGDHIPELQEKVCIPKNKDTFPLATFRHGSLESMEMVREKIYRDEDKEGGQCVVRKGFRICIILMYDSMNFEHSSMRKEEMPIKIPDFKDMEEVRVYNDDDKKKVLEAMK
mmetsp:Transcript_20639/g.39152  ORF Transcript_20639/g.39152 Transcript_20639/m.39152 type:complete len:399 (+) Transcript_20639:44-1240(+)